MNTPVKLAAFGLGLIAAFGAAAGAGAAVGPIGTDVAAATGHDGMAAGTAGGNDEEGHAAAALPAGLSVSEQGYTLELADRSLPAGAATPVAFRIVGPDGSAVREYDVDHEVDLHLIAVRRDLSSFQHVHPDLDAEGVWHVPLALGPGTWRLFADFVPTALGEKVTLGADLAVAGDYEPAPLLAESRTAEVDGYTVELAGSLTAGTESELTLSVSRDGRPVTDLQPYLGAFGHLVVLRDGDLAYLHAHPTQAADGDVAGGPDIRFATTAPSAGTYGLFLDFRHGSVVRTAAFIVTVQEHR
jgi:hypothetical protein